MTINEAIANESEVAKMHKDRILISGKGSYVSLLHEKYAQEHEQLVKWLEDLQQYQKIGTIEECLVAAEKQKPKKPIIENEQTQDCVTEVEWKCPICETNYIETAPCGEFCRYCGQRLDWSDINAAISL